MLKALLSEQLVHKSSQQTLVKFIVNLASVDALSQQSTEGIPWDLLWRQIGSALGRHIYSDFEPYKISKYQLLIGYTHHGDTVNPSVQGITSTSQIRLIEFILLGPTQGDITKTLLEDGMEPGQQEVQSSPLIGSSAHATSRNSAEGPQEVGTHAWRRLKDEDTASTEQVDRQLGVDFHGQEEAEASVRHQ